LAKSRTVRFEEIATTYVFSYQAFFRRFAGIIQVADKVVTFYVWVSEGF
jgi:hypothetical protein